LAVASVGPTVDIRALDIVDAAGRRAGGPDELGLHKSYDGDALVRDPHALGEALAADVNNGVVEPPGLLSKVLGQVPWSDPEFRLELARGFVATLSDQARGKLRVAGNDVREVLAALERLAAPARSSAANAGVTGGTVEPTHMKRTGANGRNPSHLAARGSAPAAELLGIEDSSRVSSPSPAHEPGAVPGGEDVDRAPLGALSARAGPAAVHDGRVWFERGPNLAPPWLGQVTMKAYDGKTDDLLTAGWVSAVWAPPHP